MPDATRGFPHQQIVGRRYANMTSTEALPRASVTPFLVGYALIRRIGLTIAGFQHPSSRSTSCAQCREAPPSHYMEHFDMVSRVPRQEGAQGTDRLGSARPNQCYRCHQPTSWNDILGVSYKHH